MLFSLKHDRNFRTICPYICLLILISELFHMGKSSCSKCVVLKVLLVDLLKIMPSAIFVEIRTPEQMYL